METYEQVKYKGCTINILPVDCPEDPRCWDGHYGTMYCFHKRYNLGDNHDYDHRDYDGWEEMEAQIRRDHDVIMMSPLFLYDHGGITISMGSFIGRAQHARWDSGQVGFVVVTQENIRKLQGDRWKRITKKRRELLKEWVKNEVDVYDDYLRGNVFGYMVEGPNGEDIDSCWGFYGTDWDKNGLFEHAKPEIDYYLNKQKEDYFGKLKTMIRNRVPLEQRVTILSNQKPVHYV